MKKHYLLQNRIRQITQILCTVFCLSLFCFSTSVKGQMLSLSKGSVEFPRQQNSTQLTINSSGMGWVMGSSIPSWLTLSSTSGPAGSTTITLTAQGNYAGGNSRGATITFKRLGSPSYIATLVVTQTSYLLKSSWNMDFLSESGTLFFYLTADTSWSIVSTPNWASIQSSSSGSAGISKILIYSHPGIWTARSGVIQIKSGTATLNVSVNQSANDIMYPKEKTYPTSLDFIANDMPKPINIAVQGLSYQLLSTPSWITVNSGLGHTGMVDFIPTTNTTGKTRTGIVKFKFKGGGYNGERSITVTQSGTSTLPIPTNIANNSLEEVEYKVWPNPVKVGSILSTSTSIGENYKIKLISTDGSSKIYNAKQINTSSLLPGIYRLEFILDGKILDFRMVIAY